MKKLEMKIVNLSQGVKKISLVKKPAIQEDWTLLQDEETKITLSVIDTEKRLITGPALIPNKEIPRYNEKTNEAYNIWFSEETIKETSERFLSESRTEDVTLSHQVDIEGVKLVESWIVSDPNNDKAKALGYDVPAGTWMASYKVENDEILEAVQLGEVRGFSIEGSFASVFTELSEQEPTEEDIEKGIYSDIEKVLDDESITDKKEAIEKIVN